MIAAYFCAFGSRAWRSSATNGTRFGKAFIFSTATKFDRKSLKFRRIKLVVVLTAVCGRWNTLHLLLLIFQGLLATPVRLIPIGLCNFKQLTIKLMHLLSHTKTMIDYNVKNECEMLVTHKNQAARYFFDNDSQKQTRYWSIYELDDCFCVCVTRIRKKR